MDQAEVQKQIDDALAKARAEWAKTRSWRVMRWDSIKADPQAAACVRWLAMPLPNGAAR